MAEHSAVEQSPTDGVLTQDECGSASIEPERSLVQIRPRGFSAGAQALAVFSSNGFESAMRIASNSNSKRLLN